MSVNIDSIKRNLIDRYPFFGSLVDILEYDTENPTFWSIIRE